MNIRPQVRGLATWRAAYKNMFLGLLSNELEYSYSIPSVDHKT